VTSQNNKNMEEKIMATKEAKTEQEAKVKAVQEAEKKVASIKEERAAKKAKRQEARLNWKFKGLGKLINTIENNFVGLMIGFGAGIGVGAGAVIGYNMIKNSDNNEELDDGVNSESDGELPFEA
jgi:hypothetical protein